MMSLVNKSADWTPYYHKILIFFPAKSLKSLRAARIDELADSNYKARHAHKRLYTVLPKYSKIQVLPDITSCRLVKDNKQAIELNSLLLNNMPKDGYG